MKTRNLSKETVRFHVEWWNGRVAVKPWGGLSHIRCVLQFPKRAQQVEGWKNYRCELRMEELFESYLIKKNVGVGEWSLEAGVDHNDEWNVESAWFHHLRGDLALQVLTQQPKTKTHNTNTMLIHWFRAHSHHLLHFTWSLTLHSQEKWDGNFRRHRRH